MLIARKNTTLSAIFNATVKVIFLETPRQGDSALPAEPYQDTKASGGSHSCSVYMGTDLSQCDLESRSKDSLPASSCTFQPKIPETVRKLLYPSPFSEPGSEILSSVRNGKYIGIAGIPTILVPMIGKYHNTLIHVIRSLLVTSHASSPPSNNKQFLLDAHSLTSPIRAEASERVDGDSNKSDFDCSYHWSQTDSSNRILALVGEIGKF